MTFDPNTGEWVGERGAVVRLGVENVVVDVSGLVLNVPHCQCADGYEPQPGDLVLYHEDRDGNFVLEPDRGAA